METRMKKIFGGLAAGAAVLVLAACLLPVGNGVGLQDDDTPIPVTPPDTNLAFVYEKAIKPANCKNCHTSSSHISGISFNGLQATYDAFFKSDSTPQLTTLLQTTHPIHRVQPGSLDSSYLWQKIATDGYPTVKNGTKMPASGGGSVLTATHIAIIRAWILRGAPIL
jgi:hypothetical protein